jgi:uncharacterized membrane-anchored protein YhcB (DUF1043 family)
MSPRTRTSDRHDGNGSGDLRRPVVNVEEQLKELQAQLDAVREVLAVHFAWMKTIQARVEHMTQK